MKIFISTFLVIFLALLIFLHLFLTDIPQTLNIFLQIFGGFVATLFGVYISLNLTNQEELKKEKIINERDFIESLKLILDELSFNDYLFNKSLKILDKKPKRASLVALDFKDALIASERFEEISNNFELFSYISESYHNAKITTGVIMMGEHALEDCKNILKKYRIHYRTSSITKV